MSQPFPTAICPLGRQSWTIRNYSFHNPRRISFARFLSQSPPSHISPDVRAYSPNTQAQYRSQTMQNTMQTSSGAQPSIRPPTNYKNPYNTTGAAAQKAYGIEYVASTLAMVDAIKDDAILEAYQGRQWEEGDVYGPHDLSSVQISEWKKWRSPKADAFDYLGLDPEGEYKNFAILSEFVSDFGRIKHSSETGLRPVNQRKISRAIKRAIGIGIMPSVHRHPEIIHDDVSDLENRLLEHESGD